ncbi:zinc finger BED domain-containing protein 4-like [Oryzias latipes]|uniref:zinc finger BED domain-containing protein 4-like n=1 Tax=Oryzias latipes TaxID=8090 RepID=UPI000CE2441F|nr:zinc finger BED domain-containing protein 4-like [Oryzias latipes]
MEFICLDHQPLSVVEDEGFQRLMSYLDSRYTLPGRKYFTDVCLPQLYQTVFTYVDSLMKDNITSIGFTSDIWSASVCPMSMLSLTAQFINQNFELQKVVLHSQEFSGSHTAEALVAAFSDMFQAWGIPKEKVHVILRDNAKNMEKAMRDAHLPSLPCMAHSLQLAVTEGVMSQRSIADIIASGRRIVGHFKHSPLAYSQLQSIQKQLGQPIKRLQQDVPTRWNSTVYMLQSLLEQKRALCAYVADYDLPSSMFTSSQWKLAENMISLLAPFEELTQQISSSTASAADVIPSIRALTRLLEKTAETDHGVKTSKATLLEAVQKTFRDIECERLYSIATILDPRYKDRYFSDAVKPQIRGLLSNVLATGLEQQDGEASLAASGSGPPEKVPRTGSLHAMYAELLGGDQECGSSENTSSASLQLNFYLSEPVIAQSGQPLVYWQNNKSRFPTLAQAARTYLCAPCTSVDSERLLSKAGNIIDEKRNKLSAKNAEMLIFIKKNLPLMLKK